MSTAENIQKLRDEWVEKGLPEAVANDLARHIVRLWEKIDELEAKLAPG